MKKIILIITLSALVFSLQAQTLSPQVISTSGGFYSNATASFSTTVGELAAITTLSGGNYFLTQGFQQPGNITVGIPTLPSIGFAIEIFPNPGNGLFNISMQSDAAGKLSISVYDFLGQLVASSEIKHSQGNGLYEIDLGNLAEGVYTLDMISNEVSAINSKRKIKKIQIIR